MTGLFDPVIFDADIFDVGTSVEAPSYGFLRRLLADLEKTSVSPNPWGPGVWEPGMWDKSPLRKIIQDME